MIQPCRTGNQEAPLRFIAVLQAFHKIPPTSKLVDFVEQNEWLFRKQGPPANHFPRRGIIPRQVGSVVFEGGSSRLKASVVLPTCRGPPRKTIFSPRSSTILSLE